MARSFPIHRQTNRKPRRTFRPQAEGLEARRLLNAGELDTTFGVNGPGFTLAGSGWGAPERSSSRVTERSWRQARLACRQPEMDTISGSFA